MLSDFLFDVKTLLLNEITKQKKHPLIFLYKDELQQVLEKLYKVQFAIDSNGFYTEEYYESKSKENALKDISKIIDKQPAGQRNTRYTKYGKQDGNKIWEQHQIDADENDYNKKMKELGW